ncbi:hypothetical protein ACWDKQ_22790 [Saccharopolyspora sp. NPDC000995]
MNIIAGLIGACVSLIGVTVGAWINNHRQDRRWLREKKLEAAAAARICSWGDQR